MFPSCTLENPLLATQLWPFVIICYLSGEFTGLKYNNIEFVGKKETHHEWEGEIRHARQFNAGIDDSLYFCCDGGAYGGGVD